MSGISGIGVVGQRREALGWQGNTGWQGGGAKGKNTVRAGGAVRD